MRLTERRVCYPRCDKQGNLDKVEYIHIKDKKLAEEKLCQLEDTEDELGIDLVTLFKALKNGLWYYSKQKGHLFVAPNCLLLNVFHKIIYADLVDNGGRRTGRLIIKLDKYGKTWALTREELEK